jgi:5-methylcytosine-specific restriction endonuclease McrA
MAMSTKRGDPRGTRAYKARRLEVLQRDQWSCFYCMQPATTVDHVIPIIQGGDPIAFDNLVSCCARCNSSKGSRSEGSFLARKATPPVFSQRSLPETVRTVPDSPFIKPDTLDFDAK